MKAPVNFHRHVTRTAIAVATGLAVGGCSAWGGGDRQTGPEYEAVQHTETLEIPPDMISPDTERAYRIPDAPGERVSARDLQTDAPARHARQPGQTGVLPESAQVQLQREGQTRWLRINAEPEELWDRLRAFWDNQNLPLARSEPGIGIMETEWAEDRAGIPIRGSQGFLAGILSNVYDATTRDMYRLRLERADDGGSLVYITHRGASEEPEGDMWRWTVRPSDPELEAEMLNRLLTYLTTGEVDRSGLRAPETIAERPRDIQLTEHEGRPVLTLSGDFEPTWRRLGHTLDHAGLLVDEHDRGTGTYHVTYRPEVGHERDSDGGGFFARLFGRGDELRANERFQVRLIDLGEQQLRIHAYDMDGDDLRDRDSRFVLELLQQQLRR